MWQKQEICFMVMIVTMLNSLTFCLEVNGRKGESVQSGRLIIESSRTINETKDGIFKNLQEEYVGDTNGYSSYQPESMEGSRLAKLMLRHWSPSVQCDNDSMSLHLHSSRVPKFMVETTEEGPVPLLQMPSHCGLSVKRARRDVSLNAKYNGCNVAQQGNAYVLPLRASGVFLKVVCPVARPLTVSCTPSAMVVNLGAAADAVKLKVKGVWQPVYQASAVCGYTLDVMAGGLTLTIPYTSNCWQYEGAKVILSVQCMNGELTLSCPAVQPPTTTPLLAFMQPVTRTTTTATASTTVNTLARTNEPVSADEPHTNPLLYGGQHGYGIPWLFQYNHPGSFPATHTNAASSTAGKVVPASPYQQHLNPWLPGMKPPYYNMPWPFQYSQPGTLPDTHKNTAQTTGTIVAPASPDQHGSYPWLVGMYYPYSYRLPWNSKYSQSGAPVMTPATTRTTTTPTTTVTTTPVLTTTTPATTTTISTTASTTLDAPIRFERPQWYPWLLGTYNQYVPMMPPGDSVSGPNSGIGQQTYQTSLMNTFPKYPAVIQNPGPPVFDPAKVLPYHSRFSPLQVRLGQ